MRLASISIVLLTYNGGTALAVTLPAVFNQNLSGCASDNTSPEVIAIDSGSTDSTLQTLAAYPVKLHRIDAQQFGHGRTRNLGARLARGDWLVFLSQDAAPAHDRWLFNLTRHLAESRVAAAFGRQLAPPGLGPIESFFLEQTYPSEPFRHEPTEPATAATPIRRIFFSNVNAAIKRAVLADYPFPEDVVMSEDQAFARAALRAGFSLVYDPEAGVYHGHRYSLSQLFRRNFDSGYSLRGVAGDSWRDVARMGRDYLWREIGYLARGRRWSTIPYALLYELVKSAGFAAGRSGHRLPAAWRPRLSLHPRFWPGAND